ncbi:MAG: MFS transporter [Chloroflexia bacterium]|nr:MFS transporter [Chloroflexia bacterium]
MLRKTIHLYKNSFKGFSPEIWWLALITFINRAGTMVMPFLTLYLSDQLNFSLSQVGWIMSAFGLGSFVGSWVGGKMTDRIGFYQTMFWSLFLTGLLFIGLQYVTTFWGFVVAIFISMVFADAFRPATMVSLKVYSRPENQTRSITLIRLAINLGFSFGPFLGGVLITVLSYKGLFWVDGITCLLAVAMFRLVLKEKKVSKEAKKESRIALNGTRSPYKDKPFLIFLGIMFLMAFAFFQLFSTIPLYYKEVHHLSELTIGLLMSLNAALIFVAEMPLVHILERRAVSQTRLILLSMILIALSFYIFNVSNWFGILVISMLIISVAEMFGFPFSNVFALNRSPEGREGEYMGLYTMTFSLALIFSSKVGMEVIKAFNYQTNWYLMGTLCVFAFVLGVWLIHALKSEKVLSTASK